MKTKLDLLRTVTLSVVIAPLAASAQSATLLTTIPNPTPAISERFGYAVAAVGSNFFRLHKP